ncbi:MAG: 4-hydroxybutyrate CoA-transferase, partial [Thermoleophilia bacterium]|nr:4-hydroxybutyrate CoA-transferase [Thermoleophilia bacterium]
MTDTRTAPFDPSWKEKYKGMLATPEEAVAAIRPGQRIFLGTGGAQPLQLVKALVARRHELADIQIIHMLTLGEAPYAYKELTEHFTVNTF